MNHREQIIIGTRRSNSPTADWDIGLIGDRRAGGTCLTYGSATEQGRRPYSIHPALTNVVQDALLDVPAVA